MLVEGWSALAEAREDQAAMRRYSRDTGEAEFLLAERRIVAGGIRHTDQSAAIVVRPSVIGASESVRVAAIALAYGVAAMHASVEHQVDFAVVVARDDYRLHPDLARYIVAGLRNLTLMSDVYPFAIPNLFQFLAKNRGVVVYSSVDTITLNEILVVYFGG